MNFFKCYIPQQQKIAVDQQQASVPKKIFMTWHSHYLSDDMYNNIQQWIKYNNDWELYLYDDKQVEDFIRLHFDKEVIEAYNNIYPTAYKADLFRYCVLYMYGGVYTDIKNVPLKSLNDILPKDVDFLSVKDRYIKNFEFNGYIFQSFLCAREKHPFFKKAIEMIVDNSRNMYYGNDPYSPTGPNLLGKAINRCLNKSDLSEIIPGKHQENGFTFEILAIKDHSIITSKGYKVILNSYSGYRKELYGNLNLAKRYAVCWFVGKCYIKKHTPKINSKYYLKKKELYFIDYLYITNQITKARLRALQFCILKPLLAIRILEKVIKYEKSNQ